MENCHDDCVIRRPPRTRKRGLLARNAWKRAQLAFENINFQIHIAISDAQLADKANIACKTGGQHGCCSLAKIRLLAIGRVCYLFLGDDVYP
jgi:Na+-transporting NADH:ubiquinone oxidoreductase subunit NqrF